MIRVETAGPVCVVTLDRPDRRNALDHGHCAELRRIVDEAPGSGARVLVLAGAGPHFCAGADLSGVEDSGFVAALHETLEAIVTTPVPVIAAVQGAALGAGTQLAVACDLRVAQPDARFGIPAAKLGLMVDHWTVRRLDAVAGHAVAQAMLLAAEEYSGERAHQIGFVQRLGDLGSALAWAGAIARLAPLTIAGHKLGLTLLDAGDPLPPAGASTAGDPVRENGRYAGAFAAAWASRDLQEALAARADKRPPEFHGS